MVKKSTDRGAQRVACARSARRTRTCLLARGAQRVACARSAWRTRTCLLARGAQQHAFHLAIPAHGPWTSRLARDCIPHLLQVIRQRHEDGPLNNEDDPRHDHAVSRGAELGKSEAGRLRVDRKYVVRVELVETAEKCKSWDDLNQRVPPAGVRWRGSGFVGMFVTVGGSRCCVVMRGGINPKLQAKTTGQASNGTNEEGATAPGALERWHARSIEQWIKAGAGRLGQQGIQVSRAARSAGQLYIKAGGAKQLGQHGS
eukprot:365311-Chlamydomonas_euryale.AAC.3